MEPQKGMTMTMEDRLHSSNQDAIHLASKKSKKKIYYCVEPRICSHLSMNTYSYQKFF